jgi:hypothetical protein
MQLVAGPPFAHGFVCASTVLSLAAFEVMQFVGVLSSLPPGASQNGFASY